MYAIELERGLCAERARLLPRSDAATAISSWLIGQHRKGRVPLGEAFEWAANVLPLLYYLDVVQAQAWLEWFESAYDCSAEFALTRLDDLRNEVGSWISATGDDSLSGTIECLPSVALTDYQRMLILNLEDPFRAADAALSWQPQHGAKGCLVLKEICWSLWKLDPDFCVAWLKALARQNRGSSLDGTSVLFLWLSPPSGILENRLHRERCIGFFLSSPFSAVVAALRITAYASLKCPAVVGDIILEFVSYSDRSIGSVLPKELRNTALQRMSSRIALSTPSYQEKIAALSKWLA